MADLDEKVGIVTGAASGIGWSAAALFARSGAAVIVSDIDRASFITGACLAVGCGYLAR